MYFLANIKYQYSYVHSHEEIIDKYKDNIAFAEKLCFDKEFPKNIIGYIYHQIVGFT